MSKAKQSDVDCVLRFLTKENRPFSVQNMVDALQKDGVKKTAVERSLALLVEKGEVTKKEYGKAKIFLLAQGALDVPNAEELADVDARIAEGTQQLTAIDERLADKRAQVKALSKQYTMTEALEKVAQLEEELQTKTEKLEALGDGSSLISKEEKEEIERKYMQYKGGWKKYKKVIKEIVDQISEASGKKTKELVEEIGIETDEDAGVNIADFPDVSTSTNGSNKHGNKRSSAGSSSSSIHRSASSKRHRQS